VTSERPDLVGVLSVLSRDDADALAALGRTVTHEAGDLLVRQGARDRSIHMLLDGTVKVVVTASDGRSVLLEFCGPGESIGELSVLDGRARSADVIAASSVRSLRIEGAAFLGFLRSRPELALALLRAISARLRDANVTRLEMALEPTVQRVARRLLELAATHGEPVDGALRIDMPVTQAELAEWVGASREGVSDALRQLREDGAIETARKAVLVRDVARLRVVAS
jgi:CRP/FNR family transcriptional regulator, cyclic AMP receptor protein